MDKEVVIHKYTLTYKEAYYYSAIKKNEILPFAMAWMNFNGIMLSEKVRQRNKKHHMTSLIGGKKKSKTKKHPSS